MSLFRMLWDALRPKAPAPQAVPLRLAGHAVHFAAVEDQVRGLLDAGEDEAALVIIAKTVIALVGDAELRGRGLTLPGFDRLVERLGGKLRDPRLAHCDPAKPARHVILMSAYYGTGGHSRIVDDLVRLLPDTLVTLCYRPVNEPDDGVMPDFAQKLMASTDVRLLEQESQLGKIAELQDILAGIRPLSLMLMAHHFDPVPYIAIAGVDPAVPRLFFHHADHNPALGNTMADYRHVDFTPHLQATCSAWQPSRPWLLPLAVADQGMKTFTPLAGGAINVVSAGSGTKFRLEREPTLAGVATYLLAHGIGRYWHIGPLTEQNVATVRDALAAAGIDPQRFVHIPPVPSLWATLRELDAHVYLGSFPVMGGRGAIEAQGCGYPALHYRDPDAPPLLDHTNVFADPSLGWTSHESLLDCLQRIAADHAGHARRARAFYEAGYTWKVFADTLHAILKG